MPYCTATAFKERFGEDEYEQLLASGSGRSYAAAAADADSIIDAAIIAGGYTLPLAQVPAFLIKIGADLTRYELYEEAPTDEVRERRKESLAMLRDIKSGALMLQGAARSETVGVIAVASDPRVYTDDTLAAFVGGL